MTVLVLGLAVSGRAAVEALTRRGEQVIGYDADGSAGEGLELDELRTGPWDPSLLAEVDLVVPSPGIPETSAVMGDVIASGLPIWSELELGFRGHAGVPLVAITGTNGKTTVTEMVTSMLRASGIAAAAVGNIGAPLSGAGYAEVLVVEASSFQLRFIDEFRPDAAAIVNFAPDHLDWHPDVAAYGAAKARIFENSTPSMPLVFDADDAGAAGLVAGADVALIGVSSTEARGTASGRRGSELSLAGTLVPEADLSRSDPVLVTDLCVAAELASALGATAEGIAGTATTFVPGRHRREVVAEAGGVTFVDDSKATNPHAALAAIRSYPSVVLIAGGLAKGLDVRPLARADSVRRLVVIGESAPDLMSERPDALRAESMEEAVESALALSEPGDVVLLAPGCASFDMFDSYGARGDAFAAAVREKVGA